MTNIRYIVAPQMKAYDAMEAGKAVPFAMLSGPVDYHSSTINTDRHGFRYTKHMAEYIGIDDISKFDSVNIIVGGSTVFGVGATNDDTTIASMLSEETGEPWFNMGIRGGVSLQEYVHLIRFLYKANKINNIVFFSGVNDVYVNILKDETSCFDNRFENDYSQYGCKRKFASWVLSKLFFVPQINLIDLSFKGMLLFPILGSDVKVSILSDEEREDITMDNFKRNFMLYSSLKKETGANVIYILQPFASWTEKELTIEELEIFKSLDEIQKGSRWSELRKKMNVTLYKKVCDCLCSYGKKFSISFYDSNPTYVVEHSVFVDGVHLNDEGNKIAKDFILDRVRRTR